MPPLQFNPKAILLGVLGTNEMIILLIIIITYWAVINFAKKASRELSTKIGIILLVVGLALLIIALVINPYTITGSNQAILTKSVFLLIGVLVLILGGIVLAIGVSKTKKLIPSEHKNENTIVKEPNLNSTIRYEELEKLAKLKEQGILTEEEFQEQKKKILG